MGILLVSLMAILAVEYFLCLPFGREVGSLLAIAKKSVRVLGSRRISDHWKERVLPSYAQDIIKSTLYILLIRKEAVTVVKRGAIRVPGS